jgi:hypothetical protein
VTPSMMPTMGSISLQDALRQALRELLPLDKVIPLCCLESQTGLFPNNKGDGHLWIYNYCLQIYQAFRGRALHQALCASAYMNGQGQRCP